MAITIRVEKLEDQGAEFLTRTFDQAEVIIGRGPKNDLVLPAGEVSGTHAKLYVEGSQDSGSPEICVVDLRSSNGTYVEDERIPAEQPYKIDETKRLIIGTFLLFPTYEAPAEPAVSDSEKERQRDRPTLTEDVQEAGMEGGEESLEAQPEDERIEEVWMDAEAEGGAVEVPVQDAKDEVIEPEGAAEAAPEEEDEPAAPAGERQESVRRMRAQTTIAGTTDRVFASLQAMLDDPSVHAVAVDRVDSVLVDFGFGFEPTPSPFSDGEDVAKQIRKVLKGEQVSFSAASPFVSECLKKGLFVSAHQVADDKEAVTAVIRKTVLESSTVEELLSREVMSSAALDTTITSIAQGASVLICGSPGTGKTTLLSALIAELPKTQRSVFIRSMEEPICEAEHVIMLRLDPPNGGPEMGDLLRHAQALRPDRIIVGDCRKAGRDFLSLAFATPFSFLTTVGASSPEAALTRLSLLCGQGTGDLTAKVVDIVIHCALSSSGAPEVDAIYELASIGSEGRPELIPRFMRNEAGELKQVGNLSE